MRTPLDIDIPKWKLISGEEAGGDYRVSQEMESNERRTLFIEHPAVQSGTYSHQHCVSQSGRYSVDDGRAQSYLKSERL